MKHIDRKLELDHETVGVLTLDPVANSGRWSFDDEFCPITSNFVIHPRAPTNTPANGAV